MAEATALAFAAEVVKVLQMHQTTLLSDNQQLVQFLNGSDHTRSPIWRIKPYTRIISSMVHATAIEIHKIRRIQNQLVDPLARQALRGIDSNHHCNDDCSYAPHEQECSLLIALQNITINSVIVITTSYC
jgi:ribonuclease HI